MKVIYTKTQYFNMLNRSEKAQIKKFIVELGYTDPKMLSEHIVECSVAKRFSISSSVLRQIIGHYEQPSSEE